MSDMHAITAAEYEAHPDHWLIDFQREGAPLVISFGFYNAATPPAFDFYGRLKKLELISGRPLNKLLLRDPRRLWYLTGIAGLSHDVPSTVAALRDHIARINPSCIITLGQSMGGFAAILYGVLLGARKTVCFGPVSCFDAAIWAAIGDKRWAPIIPELDATGVPYAAYQNLPALMHAHAGPLPDIDLVFGTSPGPGIPREEAVSYDAVHAFRFDRLPNVQLLPIHPSPHAAVEYLRQHGQMTEFLRYRLFGVPMNEVMPQEPPTWEDWADENLRRGGTASELHRIICESSMTAEQADQILDAAHWRSTIRALNAAPPRVIIP